MPSKQPVEPRIIGAMACKAVELGADISFDGTIFRVSTNHLQATLQIDLTRGTEMIIDAVGEPELFIPLLEAAQNICEDFW